jgi:hypothetical protein
MTPDKEKFKKNGETVAADGEIDHGNRNIRPVKQQDNPGRLFLFTYCYICIRLTQNLEHDKILVPVLLASVALVYQLKNEQKTQKRSNAGSGPDSTSGYAPLMY